MWTYCCCWVRTPQQRVAFDKKAPHIQRVVAECIRLRCWLGAAQRISHSPYTSSVFPYIDRKKKKKRLKHSIEISILWEKCIKINCVSSFIAEAISLGGGKKNRNFPALSHQMVNWNCLKFIDEYILTISLSILMNSWVIHIFPFRLCVLYFRKPRYYIHCDAFHGCCVCVCFFHRLMRRRWWWWESLSRMMRKLQTTTREKKMRKKQKTKKQKIGFLPKGNVFFSFSATPCCCCVHTTPIIMMNFTPIQTTSKKQHTHKKYRI